MLHQPRRALQDAPLQGHELVDVLGLQMPPGIGIAPPGAAAAAGRIQQHAVELPGMALDPGIALAHQAAAFHVKHARAVEPRRRALDPADQHVAGHELALVLHRCGQRQGLAAGPGAEIGDPLAGLGIHQQRDELGAFVLHLDQPGLEALQAGERRPSRHPQAQRGERRRLAPPPPPSPARPAPPRASPSAYWRADPSRRPASAPPSRFREPSPKAWRSSSSSQAGNS